MEIKCLSVFNERLNSINMFIHQPFFSNQNPVKTQPYNVSVFCGEYPHWSAVRDWSVQSPSQTRPSGPSWATAGSCPAGSWRRAGGGSDSGPAHSARPPSGHAYSGRSYTMTNYGHRMKENNCLTFGGITSQLIHSAQCFARVPLSMTDQ